MTKRPPLFALLLFAFPCGPVASSSCISIIEIAAKCAAISSSIVHKLASFSRPLGPPFQPPFSSSVAHSHTQQFVPLSLGARAWHIFLPLILFFAFFFFSNSRSLTRPKLRSPLPAPPTRHSSSPRPTLSTRPNCTLQKPLARQLDALVARPLPLPVNSKRLFECNFRPIGCTLGLILGCILGYIFGCILGCILDCI